MTESTKPAEHPPVPPPEHHVSNVRKKKAKRRLVIITVTVAVVAVAFWIFENSLSLPFQQLGSFGNSLESSLVGQIQENFSAPPPLHGPTKIAHGTSTALTHDGVISQTNLQRSENGNLPALVDNATLDDIAMLRLDDMFQQQYFAHVGPQGESALTVASTVGYAYVALGENLALGNFTGDTGVVAAWMASPGHRANILDTHYTQIGVAVQQGVFQGTTEWIAVQIFGKPASACPAADPNLEAAITSAEAQLSTMSAQLQSEKTSISEMQPQSGPAYNDQVNSYNTLVAQYNTLAGQVKTEIAQYNAEASAFNACIGE
jgi:uncharacterized protein YkwD